MLVKMGTYLIAFPTLTFLVNSLDTVYMEGKQQLLTALHQIIAELETVGDDTISDMGLVELKLETLGEAALLNGDISLLAIDLINQARQLCISSGAYSSFFFFLQFYLQDKNTYTTYNKIILTNIYNYIARLILTLFIQANRTIAYATYNTNVILTFTFTVTLHCLYQH